MITSQLQLTTEIERIRTKHGYRKEVLSKNLVPSQRGRYYTLLSEGMSGSRVSVALFSKSLEIMGHFLVIDGYIVNGHNVCNVVQYLLQSRGVLANHLVVAGVFPKATAHRVAKLTDSERFPTHNLFKIVNFLNVVVEIKTKKQMDWKD